MLHLEKDTAGRLEQKEVRRDSRKDTKRKGESPWDRSL